MPFDAKLTIDNEEFRILECSYELSREIDEFGKPTTAPKGGTITITIESSGNPLFIVWMTSAKLRKKGAIVFEDPTEDAELKKVEFEDAYLIKYKESYGMSNSKTGMVESFTLSAKKMTIGEAEQENKWYK